MPTYFWISLITLIVCICIKIFYQPVPEPIPVTAHVTLFSRTPDYTRHGSFSEDLIFFLDDQTRIATSAPSSKIATLLPGDTGMLTYSALPNTTYMRFISFVPDSSPATETDVSALTERTSDAAMLATIISITPDTDNVLSRVLFEFEDGQRVKLSVPFAQADLLAPGDKGALVYEGSTFVSFTRA